MFENVIGPPIMDKEMWNVIDNEDQMIHKELQQNKEYRIGI